MPLPSHHRIKLTAGLIASLSWSDPAAAQQVDYVRDVHPILQAYCIGCHTADDPAGDLVMETHAALMAGGQSGLAITAGVPDSSRLWLMAAGKMEPVMPPDDAQGPSDAELAVLADWISQGAIGPDGDEPIRTLPDTPLVEVDAAATHPITSLAVTAAGREGSSGLTAIGRSGDVTLQDEAGNVLATLTKFPGKVNSVAFDAAGDKLIVASGVTGLSGYAAIIDLADVIDVGSKSLPVGDMAAVEFIGHRDMLYCAVLSPDAKVLATAGYDREIILWDAATGNRLRSLTGHNGAVYDLAFSPDGSILVSGSADETAKVWRVDSGQRLDTLSQSEGEVLCVAVTPDGRFVIAGSGDNRVRIWRLTSKEQPAINPIQVTRFVDESPILSMVVSRDGRKLTVVSEQGNVKVLDTDTWSVETVLEPLGETASDMVMSPDDREVLISTMDGQVRRRAIRSDASATDTPVPDATDSGSAATEVASVHLDLGDVTNVTEPSADGGTDNVVGHPVPRGAKIRGSIAAAGQVDRYTWRGQPGEIWAIDADAVATGDLDARLDPIVTITDDQGKILRRTRLQAVRDSYFTFRGKDSLQSDDFRLFAWQEMKLNDYLYAAGEVTRLWMHPRGPDSGFIVYPGMGQRWTYFGTTHSVHALGEPAYVVRELDADQPPIANGLPVFDIPYQNDDDPQRIAGKNSRLIFKVPRAGDFVVVITDARGEGGEAYAYDLTIRAASPSFEPTVTKITKPIIRQAGREFEVGLRRIDGFDGPVTFDIQGLPAGIHSSLPVTIQAGQMFAQATLWADADVSIDSPFQPTLIATAEILGKRVERNAGTLGPLTIGDSPQFIPRIVLADDASGVLTVGRGDTVTAKVVVDRQTGFDDEISLGKDFAARNASHGVIVDNIGLNGLLLLKGMNEREFFITADEATVPGRRAFFLKAEIDGGITTLPIQLEVTP